MRRLLLASSTFVFFLTACGVAPRSVTPLAGVDGMHGTIHGGQQPISGATVQLYAANTSAAEDGAAATPLLTSAVQTDANGGFNLTGLYTCPTAPSYVYVLATGGSSSPGTTNPNIAIMAALGLCSSLSSSTNISANEITTVAAVNALAPFMTSYAAMGSTASDAGSLAAGFTLASQFADTAAGSSPGPSVPAGYVAPVATIHTLADVAAACINSSGGAYGDSTPCGTLFTLTVPSGAPTSQRPSDTIGALLLLAKNPTLNTSSLYNLSSAFAPFQPQLSAAPDNFAVSLIASLATLQFSAASVVVPTTTVGYTSGVQTVTLQNTGTATATFSDIGFSGADAAVFTQTNSCSTSLAPGASCAFQITATPTAVGSQTATLTVNGNAALAPSVAVSVTGGNPTNGPLTLSSTQLGWTIKGTYQDLTLTNIGSTPISFKSFVVGEPTSFPIQKNTCGTMLPAQSVCTVSIQATFSGSSTLTITDDAATSPQQVGLLYEAFGVPQSASIGTFANTAVGSQSSATFLYSYAGGGNSNINATIQGANASDFSASAACSYVLNTYQCNFPVYFKPTATGQRSAQILVSSTQYLPLTGLATGGAGAQLQAPATATILAYISPNGVASGSTTVTITNNGGTTLNFASLPVFSSGVSHFQSSGSCSSVAVNASCVVTVSFAANTSTPGTQTATLLLKDANSGVSQTVAITAATQYPAPAISPSSYSFGNVQVGASPSATFTVKDVNGNPLDHALTISQSTISSAFTLSTTSCPASTTAPCIFNLFFAPLASGSGFSDTITVTDTVTGMTSVAIATANASGSYFTITPTQRLFGSQQIGTSTSQTFTVGNYANSPLGHALTLLQSEATDYMLSTTSCPASTTVPLLLHHYLYPDVEVCHDGRDYNNRHGQRHRRVRLRDGDGNTHRRTSHQLLAGLAYLSRTSGELDLNSHEHHGYE